MAGSDTEPRQTPEELQAEIDREQRRLAETLDELSEQARPSNIAKRQIGRAKERGARILDEARALVVGGGAVRVESRVVRPEEGSIVLKGDDKVVTTYQSRGRLPTEALILAAGVGTIVAVGVVAWAVRRKRG
ncbi:MULTISPECIES: DUF3618 domain-containing protein [Nocardiopsis]|uniref:DUF3618 domain-containing protein n=2 Tax=Nocardiopsis alba TaxID=53437 RepID=A0A7K2IVY5_9ACTN|nr:MULTISPECIES: DUF3618 domain-containing protein [Nocardiopsis]AFR10929.1 hypothetical protein B005_3284 [Nocardiopsis alba ATCC BAA-2165]MEC3894218.1 DUF3618 domain-containing protein [Nocardiopsis sp. LDBS1602]MYR34007.1 DUF3618 domain-containing protein [Nocardiopsis alba]